jgi:hypothetical protein
MKMITLSKIDIALRSLGNYEQIVDAWQVSRPNDMTSSFDDIIKMDVPVNEFMTFNFVAKAPILVREVLCSMRNHVVWARSSRVDDLRSWEVWNEISDEELAECRVLKKRMLEEMESSHQDDFRRHLPVCYMTTFSFAMTLRDLAKFMRACLDFGHQMLEDFVDEISKAVREKSYAVSALLHSAVRNRNYKPMPLMPTFSKEESGRVGDFIVVSLDMSLSLRSQAIRHRALILLDKLHLLFDEMSLASSMETQLPSQIMMPKDFAEELVRKRSCWIAQTDLWKPVVIKLEEIIGFSNEPLLPCNDGKCRFKIDNDLRKAGMDPSPPCPVAAKIEKEKFSAETAAVAMTYAHRRPHLNFWLKEIENAIQI